MNLGRKTNHYKEKEKYKDIAKTPMGDKSTQTDKKKKWRNWFAIPDEKLMPNIEIGNRKEDETNEE